MSLTDYKAKYMDLKAKYQETVDLAWRLGFEQGLQQAQLDQAQQQSMQADAMVHAGQPQPGQEADPAEESQDQEVQSPVSQNPNGDELDQHINKLESMLGKSEFSSLELQDLKKTLNDIRSLQVQINLTKSMESIKNTKLGKLNKSLNFSPKVQANLPEAAKKTLSTQEKMVQDIFAKWEKDEAKATNDISSILNVEGITKKD